MDPADLYGLALDRFVPERGALAKALRADGQREQAARVAALRKPSVAAWAVNQVVRTQGHGVKRLLDAGDALRAAQEDLLAGRGDARKLRAAGERERAAVDGLVDAARGLLTSEGHELSAAVLDRVADTLHAAALDEEAREQARDGRLERELRHVGFGLGEGAIAAPSSTRAPRKETAKETRPKETRAKEGRGKEARPKEARPKQSPAKEKRAAAERDRAAARRAARKAETAARRRVERAARALEEAQERHDRAARALEKAGAALASAREEAEAAADGHRRAQADLDDAT